MGKARNVEWALHEIVAVRRSFHTLVPHKHLPLSHARWRRETWVESHAVEWRLCDRSSSCWQTARHIVCFNYHYFFAATQKTNMSAVNWLPKSRFIQDLSGGATTRACSKQESVLIARLKTTLMQIMPLKNAEKRLYFVRRAVQHRMLDDGKHMLILPLSIHSVSDIVKQK